VTGHDHAGAAGIDVAEQLEDPAGGALVEVTSGFVGQEDRRVVDERPGNRDALLLTARQFSGIGTPARRQPDLRQDAVDASRDRVGPCTRDLQREGDIFFRRPVLQQPEVLEDDAEAAPELGYFAPREIGDVEPRDAEFPMGRSLVGGDELEDGGLPGAGVAGQKDKLPLRNAEGEVLYGHSASRIGHRYLRKSNHGWKITTSLGPAPDR
jgi:hypothetical protein